ncbi:MAG: S-layer homology domain-containing protein [Oscillospiraceae bacterium]
MTASTLRYATGAEAAAVNANATTKVTGSEGTYIYGDKTNSSNDTAGWASNITFGKDFDFAKPAYTGTAATVSSVAKSGSNVVVTATIPSGETGEYGYSATNSSASVTNWQSSSSFAVPTTPGTYYFFARVAENASHKAGGESAGTSYTVNGPLSLSYTAPASMTVDTAISEMAPTVSGGSGSYTNYAVTAGTLPTGLSLNTTTGVISGTPTAVAGAADVTITVTDSDSDTQTYVIHFPAVAKKANTMASVTQADVEYGTEVNPSATSNGSTPTYQYKVKGADDGTYTSTKPTTVGEYTVKASSTGHATVADAVVTTDFAITQKILTGLNFTGVTVTKVYDGTTSAGAVGGSAITFTGKVGTDDVSIKAVAGEYTDANVGTGKTVTLTLSLDGTAKDNYKLASYSETFNAAAITAATQTITVTTPQTIVKNGVGIDISTWATSNAGVTPTYTLDGTPAGITLSGTTLTAANASTTATSFSIKVNSDTVDKNGDSTPEYSAAAEQTITVNVTAKDDAGVSITSIVPTSKTYGDDNFTLTATKTCADGTNGQWQWTSSDTSILEVVSGENAATATIRVKKADTTGATLTVSYTSDTHYDSETTAAIKVNPKTLTADDLEYTGTAITKAYDGDQTCSLTSVSVKSSALVGTDTLPVTGTAAYDSANAGSRTVTFTPNAITTGNYSLAATETLSIPATITPKDVSITAVTVSDKDYNGDADATVSSVTIPGASGNLTMGTDFEVTSATFPDADADAANVNVTINVALKDDAASNYNLTNGTGYVVSSAAKINKVNHPTYGTTKTDTTYAIRTVAGTKDYALPCSELAGVSYSVTGKTTANIVDTADPSISGNTLTYTSKVCGTADLTDTITIKITSTNYNDITLTLTVSASNKTNVIISGLSAATGLTYNGSAQAGYTGTATYSPAWTGTPVVTYYLNDGTTKTTTANSGAAGEGLAPKNAGNYKVTIAIPDSDPTYTGNVTLAFEIAKKDVTVAPKSFTITKGNAIPTFELVYTGLVGSDTLTPSDTPDFTCYETGTTPVSTTTAAGTYTITWTNEGATTFTGADNYNVAKTATGTLTINNPAPIGGGVTTYSITVDSVKNGAVTVSRKSASKGTTVTITAEPDEGYVLRTLTVVDEKGAEVELTDKGEGKYSFVMPDSKVTVTASFKCSGGELCVSHTFTDVDTGKWYHEAIDYVVENNLMNGVGGGLFAPNGDTYRGTLLTILYRLEGEPAVDSGSVFSDVPEGAWYHDAVLWAASNGIVEGYGNGVFGAKDPITREQFAAILYRYAQYKGYDVTARGDLSTYTDGASTHGWAEAALSWANAVGIIDGLGENLIDPTGGAIRAQAAKMLFQFCKIFME